MAHMHINIDENATHADSIQLRAQKSIGGTPKHHFTPSSSETHMNYKRLKALLCHPDKSNRDAKFIYSELKDFNFFTFLIEQQNFIEEEAIHLCKYLKYQAYKAGSTIYNEGDLVDFKIYLVLSGQLTKAVKKLDFYSAQNISKLKEKIKIVKNANKLFSPRHVSNDKKDDLQSLGMEVRAYPMSIKTQEVVNNIPSISALKFAHHKSVDPPSVSSPITQRGTKKKKTFTITNTENHTEENIDDQADLLRHIQEDAHDNETFRLLGENSELMAAAKDENHRFMFKKKKTIVAKDKGVVVDTKKPGDFFGEGALSGTSKTRTESVVAITDCELIIIERDVLLKMRNHIEDSAVYLWNFLLNYMPGLDKVHSGSIVDNLMSLIEPKRLEKGSILTQEGDKGSYFFIIKEGECEAFKTWTTNIENHHKFKFKELENHYGLDKHITEQLKIFVTTMGTFVGEEILFKADGSYDYTVKVTSLTSIVYMIEKTKFALRFPSDVFVGMRKMFENKKANNDKVYHQKINFYLEEFDTLHQSHIHQPDKIHLSDLPSLDPPTNNKRSRFQPSLGITTETPELLLEPSYTYSTRNSELPLIRPKVYLSPEEQELAKKLKQYQRTQALLPIMKMAESPRSVENLRQMREYNEQTCEISKYKFDFGDNYDQRKLDLLFNHLKKIHIIREPAPRPHPEKMDSLPQGSYEERGEIIASNLLISSARLWSEIDEPYEKSISSKAVFSSKNLNSPRLSYMTAKKERVSPMKSGYYFGKEFENGQSSPEVQRRVSPMLKSHHQSLGDGINFGKSYTNQKIKIVKKIEFKPKVIQGIVRKVQK